MKDGLHIDNDGWKYWYKNGDFHRDGDLPAIIIPTGEKHFFKNGMRHRDNDLPSVIYPNGKLAWYKNDNVHRDTGFPAIIEPIGCSYYLDDVEYSEEEYWKELGKNYGLVIRDKVKL